MTQDDGRQQALKRRYTVRQVTDYQVSWMQKEEGQEGLFTLQLILDKGVEEQILIVDADDLDVLLSLLGRSGHVMHDRERNLLIFENLKPH